MMFSPSFGLALNTAVRYVLVVSFFFGCAAVPLFAGGGQEQETEVQLQKPPAYVSPGNPTTGHDQLVIDNIKLKIDKNAAIKSYILNIYNKSGAIIFTKSEAKLEGRGFLADAFNVGEIPQVKVPSSMTWPGTGLDGKIVADGEYFYQLTVLDSYSKKSSSPPLSVVVDTKAPAIVSARSNNRVFSPNGDGVKDTITFFHGTDSAYEWTESIVDASGAVLWKKVQTAPGDTASTDQILSAETTWDGKTSETVADKPAGTVVSEGAYTYKLMGKDRAGNTASKDIPVTVSFSKSDLGLTVKDDNTYFSSRKGLIFVPSVGTPAGIQSWTLEIADKDGIVVRRITGNGLPPEVISWSGTGMPGRPESEGIALKDGVYTAELSAQYDSGTVSVSDAVSLSADSEAPKAQLALDTLPESTNRTEALVFGAAKKEELSIALRYEPDYDWEVELERLDTGFSGASQKPTIEGQPKYFIPLKTLQEKLKQASSSATDDGQTLANYEWSGALPANVNGNAAGQLPNGTWQITVRTTDKAGNLGESKPVRFIKVTIDGVAPTTNVVDPVETVDTSKPTIVAEPKLFTPDGDGIDDTITLTLNPNVAREAPAVAEWKVEILDPAQHRFRVWSGEGTPPSTLVFDGKSESGEVVQSAMDYSAVFTLTDAQKNVRHALATIAVDILVFKDGNRLRIALPSIQFSGDSSDLFQSGQAVLDANLNTLRRLAQILNRFEEHQITIEGHATFANSKTAGERANEQKTELLPLSANRAIEVKQALIILKVADGRMKAVGIGGSQPVVSHDDKDNRWKNRRVEFILEK